MADNARFHNKLHRKNHHTLPTTGYPDSAIDPIASPDEPFQGDFFLTGSLSAQDNVYVGDRLGVRTSNPNYPVSINGSLSATDSAILDNDLYVGDTATIVQNLSSLGNTVLGTDANDDITINAGPIKMPNAVNAVDGIIMGGDTNLYRGSANTLQTDDSLYVRANTTLGDDCTDTTSINGTLNINCATSTNGIKFSNGAGTYDTNLYRGAADTLKTDDSFEVGGNTTLGDANTDQTVIRGITKIADSSPTNGILFGSGNANYDVNLYRKSADVLKTDDAFEVGGGMSISGDFSVAGNTTLGDTCADTTTVNGSLVINCTTEANGIRFSNGAGGTDTVLFRGGADILRTNDAFVAGSTLNVNGNTTLGDANTDQTVIRGITKIADSSSGNGILFGSGDANYDTNLYRSAANELTTDDNFKVAGSTTLGDANTDQTILRGTVKIADSSSTNGILFGTGDANYDTNLYRSAANELRTNDNMIIDGDLTIVGNLTALGTYSRLDTLITGTSSMQIINAGSDVALYVKQTGATDVAAFYDDSETAFIIKNGGNVGIGTPSPQGRLHVDGENTNDSIAEIYVTGSCGWTQIHTSLPQGSWNPIVRDCDKAIIFSEGTKETGNFVIAPWSDSTRGIRMLGTNGNVGIDVVTPGTKLDVAGDGRFTANAQTLSLVGTDHSYIGWYPDGVAAGRKAWTGFGNATQNYFSITNEITDGSGHIVLTPGTNANVGIGTSTPTAGKLVVNGNIVATTTGGARGYIGGDNSNDIEIGTLDAGTSMIHFWNRGNATYMDTTMRNLNATGTATIGTIAAGSTDTVLVVDANGLVQQRTINSGAWSGTAGGMVDGNGTVNYLPKWQDSNTLTSTSNVYDDGTNVGIGTAAPGVTLDVNGTAAVNYLRVDPQDGTNEGGEIQLVGAGTNGTFQIDNFAGNARIHTLGASKYFQVLGGNSTLALRVENGGGYIAGNTGIGTDIPACRLAVVANGSTFGNPVNNNTASGRFENSNSTDATAHASIALRTNGAAAGDPFISYDINGVAGWSTGIDNSDGDKFKIANNWADVATTTRLTIDTAGNVGIGTTAPGVRLQVENTSAGVSTTWQGGTDFLKLFASDNNFSEQAISFQETGTNVGARIGVKNTANGAYDIIFANRPSTSTTSAQAERMRIRQDGNVGIGTNNPLFLLHVNGTLGSGAITCTTVNTQNNNITMGTGDLTCDTIGCGAITSTTITTNNNTINAGTGAIDGGTITGTTLRSTGDVVAYFVSDSRLKDNKVPLSNSVEKLQKIEAYSFDWKEVDESICTRKGHDVGLLAQEVREILPEAILERDNGYLSLDYIKMIPLLVSSIKELKAEIELLKAK